MKQNISFQIKITRKMLFEFKVKFKVKFKLKWSIMVTICNTVNNLLIICSIKCDSKPLYLDFIDKCFIHNPILYNTSVMK
jgi:hypothetical protein